MIISPEQELERYRYSPGIYMRMLDNNSFSAEKLISLLNITNNDESLSEIISTRCTLDAKYVLNSNHSISNKLNLLNIMYLHSYNTDDVLYVTDYYENDYNPVYRQNKETLEFHIDVLSDLIQRIVKPDYMDTIKESWFSHSFIRLDSVFKHIANDCSILDADKLVKLMPIYYVIENSGINNLFKSDTELITKRDALKNSMTRIATYLYGTDVNSLLNAAAMLNVITDIDYWKVAKVNMYITDYPIPSL